MRNDMIGRTYREHPWGIFDAPIIVEDAGFPRMRQLPRSFVLHDEVYQLKDYSGDKIHELMSLERAQFWYENNSSFQP